jgi:hypothetical protein
MITEEAFLGNGVYIDKDQYGSITLSYGGPQGPSVTLNKEGIENLLVFLKIKPLYDIEPLRKIRREEIENANDKYYHDDSETRTKLGFPPRRIKP